MTDLPLLEVKDLRVEFTAEGAPPARALEAINLSVRRGEMLGLVGESGCGKTTLALSLVRLLPANGRATAGQINFMGRDLLAMSAGDIADTRWKDIAIVFQGAMNALNPVRTIEDQIAETLVRHNIVGTRAARTARVRDLLALVGISPDRKDQFPHQYSGGMRQRAMIAMALACNPQLLIADEPTTALDVMIQAQILELLSSLRSQLGLAVILVTHDLGVVAEVCDSVMVMYGGTTAEYADVDSIFNRPQHPYTQQLLAAFPDISRPADKLASIPGHPPRLTALPPGCRFAPRCPAAYDLCHNTPPMPIELNASPRHIAACHLLAKP